MVLILLIDFITQMTTPSDSYLTKMNHYQFMDYVTPPTESLGWRDDAAWADAVLPDDLQQTDGLLHAAPLPGVVDHTHSYSCR